MQVLKLLKRIQNPLIKRSQRCLPPPAVMYRYSMIQFSSRVAPPSNVLKGKKAIITGCGGGIGGDTMRLFSEAGAEVIGVEIDEKKADAMRSVPNSEVIVADVTKENEIKAYVSHAMKKWNGIDILVNAAGDAKYVGPLIDATTEVLLSQMDIELMAKFWNCKYVIPHMIEKGGGSVINLSTVGAFVSAPNWGVYITSKAAILGLSRSLSIENVAKGVRVNSVCPGWIDTELVKKSVYAMGYTGDYEDWKKMAGETQPIQRLGRGDEVAQVMLFLASDASSLCSGQDYLCDSGLISSL